MWMKWHHQFADGPAETSWLDLQCTPEQALCSAEEEVIELEAQYEWAADSYRGVSFELVEIPPVEVIERHLIRAEVAAVAHKQRAEELRELLKKATT